MLMLGGFLDSTFLSESPKARNHDGVAYTFECPGQETWEGRNAGGAWV